jgi:hypothetical protein
MTAQDWDGTSTGLYFVCQPTFNATSGSFGWAVIAGGTAGISLGIPDPGTGDFTAVAGDPHGVAQTGTDLNILGYDSPDLYTVSIAALKGMTAGGDLVVTVTTIDPAFLPQDPGNLTAEQEFKVHGNGLMALTDEVSEDAFLYAQYNGAIENVETHIPEGYTNSTVVRLTEDLAEQTFAVAGKNAMGMVPLPNRAGRLNIAIPCQGNIMHYGATNGMDSSLYRIGDLFASSMASVPALIGDWSTALTPEGTRDFKSVTFSDDGLFGYVLCVTYNSSGMACWKLYQTTAANILGAFNMPISTAIDKNLLVPLDGEDGVAGSDWEVLYENAALARQGRLWFVRGTTIQVSQGNLYSNQKLFSPTEVYGSSGGGYINSADLIREMIYQYEKGHSINTNLIKHRTAAKLAKVGTAKLAAVRAVAAPEEEEEEGGGKK